jgi:hypothetical protein
MSSSDHNSGKNVLPTALGAMAGGLGVGAVVYNKHANALVKDIYDPESAIHKEYAHVLEQESDAYFDAKAAAEEEDEIERLIHGKNKSVTVEPSIVHPHSEKIIDRHNSIMEGVKETEASVPFQEAADKIKQSEPYRKLTEAKKGLEALEENARNVSQVHFYQTDGVPVTKVILRAKDGLVEMPDGSLAYQVGAKESLTISGVDAPKGSILVESAQKKGVNVLKPEEIETLANSEWFTQAKQSVSKLERSLDKDFDVLFRKAAPTGWCWKHMPDGSKGAVVFSALLGATVVGALVHTLTGSHRDKALQRQQAQAAQDSPFAGI